jgi:hypothetical protein
VVFFYTQHRHIYLCVVTFLIAILMSSTAFSSYSRVAKAVPIYGATDSCCNGPNGSQPRLVFQASSYCSASCVNLRWFRCCTVAFVYFTFHCLDGEYWQARSRSVSANGLRDGAWRYFPTFLLITFNYLLILFCLYSLSLILSVHLICVDALFDLFFSLYILLSTLISSFSVSFYL